MRTEIGEFRSVDYQRGYLRGVYGSSEGAAPMKAGEEREGYERGVMEDE